MIRELFCVALLTAATGICRADDMAERRKLAVEITQTMTKDKLTPETIRASIMQQVDRTIAQKGMSPEDALHYREAAKAACETIDADTFYGMFSEGYAKHLSLDELKGLQAFYQSPAGKALLREQIEIQKDQNLGLNQLYKQTMELTEAKLRESKGNEGAAKPEDGKPAEEKKGE